MTIPTVTAGGTIDASWGNAVANTLNGTSGDAWGSYTPTLSQGASTDITKSVLRSAYTRIGRIVVWTFYVQATAAGTAGSSVQLTLPTEAASIYSLSGMGYVYDASGPTSYVCTLAGASSTKVQFINDASGNNAWGGIPNVALASGDILLGTITYEALA